MAKGGFPIDCKIDTVLMGERLRRCRNAKQMTMKEFAELCGISERYLADIERGYKAPKLDTLVRIVNAANVSADYLLQDSLLHDESEDGNIQNVLQTLAPEQRKIISDFIAQFSATFKR